MPVKSVEVSDPEAQTTNVYQKCRVHFANFEGIQLHLVWDIGFAADAYTVPNLGSERNISRLFSCWLGWAVLVLRC